MVANWDHSCQAYLEVDTMAILQLRVVAMAWIWAVILALTGKHEEGEGET